MEMHSISLNPKPLCGKQLRYYLIFTYQQVNLLTSELFTADVMSLHTSEANDGTDTETQVYTPIISDIMIITKNFIVCLHVESIRKCRGTS